jgi:hypothetical protein
VLSSWCLDELRAYRRTRFPARLYLPLALFLGAASLAAGEAETGTGLAVRLVLAYSLLFQFRLWDDLADAVPDRQDHRERLPGRAASRAAFYLLLAAAFAGNATIFALERPAPVLGAYLLLCLFFLAWYGMFHQRWRGTLAGYHVVLLKYPAFVYLLGTRAPAGLAPCLGCAMAQVYLCFCVYEGLHDARLQAVPGALGVLAMEMTGMAVLAGLGALALGDRAGSAAIQSAAAVLGAVVLALLFQCHRLRRAPGLWCFAVFLVSFAWLVNLGVFS